MHSIKVTSSILMLMGDTVDSRHCTDAESNVSYSCCHSHLWNLDSFLPKEMEIRKRKGSENYNPHKFKKMNF